jgi:OHCU decarboxylase
MDAEILPDSLNNKSKEEAYNTLINICSSEIWAENMVESMPFQSFTALYEIAAKEWWSLSQEEWLKAFAAHPKLGDRAAPQREAKEQSGTALATTAQLNLLSQLNEEYYQMNGFVFLLCATGVSIEDMLLHIQNRLKNDTITEVSF